MPKILFAILIWAMLPSHLWARIPTFYAWFNALDSSGMTTYNATAELRQQFKIQPHTAKDDLLRGRIYLNIGKHDSALYAIYNALHRKDKAQEFPAFLLLSENYIYLNHYDSASYYAFSMLEQAEETKDKELIALSFYQLAKVYYYISANASERPQSLDYIQKSMAIKSEWLEIQALSFNLLAALYQETGKWNIAIEYSEKCLKIREHNRTEYRLPKLLTLLAFTHSLNQNYDKALPCLERALVLAEKYHQEITKGFVLTNLGEVYDRQQKYDKALFYYLQSLDIANKTNNLDRQSNAILHVSDCYYSMKNYKKAADYYILHHSLKIKIFNQSLPKEIAKVRVEYETEKKEKENRLLKLQNELQATQQKQLQQFYNALIIGISVFILLLIGGFWTFYAWKRWKLQHENQRKEWDALMEGEQKERIRIARELHDGLGQSLAAIRMHLSVLQNKSEENLKKNIQTVLAITDNTIKEVRAISHELLPEELAEIELTKALQAILDKIPPSDFLKIELQTDENIPMLRPLQQVHLLRIVQEVLTNMLRHAEASLIRIQLQKNANGIILLISDNGKGFDTNKIDSFAGLGWKNIQARTQILKANWGIESVIGQGTRFRLEFKHDK